MEEEMTKIELQMVDGPGLDIELTKMPSTTNV